MTPETLQLSASDWIPNNPHLAVLLYRSALQGPDASSAFEEVFARNRWSGIWRNGIYDYQHFHAQAHEVLGVGRGRARVLLGGPDGHEIAVSAGDAIVLPAGTGHCRLDASPDYVIVGAYPPGQRADMCTAALPASRIAMIADVALPETDPLLGFGGPLTNLWSYEPLQLRT